MRKFFVTLLLLVIILFCAAGIFLKKGIHFDTLNAGPATLNQISLEWHSKLVLQIERVAIDSIQDSKDEGQPLDLSFVKRIVPVVQWIDRLFSEVLVEKIIVGGIEGTLKYEASMLYLDLSSPIIETKVVVRLEKNVLIATVQELNSERFRSRATGAVHLDLTSKSGTGQFTVNLADDSLPVALSFSVDRNQIIFEGKEAGIITDITPFVDLLAIDPATQKWITDYLTGNRYELKSFSGSFPWNDPLVLLENFLAEIRVDACQYVFAPGFASVQSDYTDLTFKKGVLTIVPHNPTFYGWDGEHSWLDINFNDFDNIMLKAYVEVDASANQNVVDLMQYYDIPLPFLQTHGETAVDLTLTINLNSEVVQADGVFLVDNGRVDYLGANYGVKNAKILLDTSKITFEKMRVSFEKLFVADVTGVFDAIPETGKLTLTLDKCDLELGNASLVLDDAKSRPVIHYTIKADGADIDAEASSWMLDDLPVNIGPFSTPFALETFSGKIASTALSCPPFISTQFSGSFSLKEKKVDLKCELFQCDVKGLKLLKGLNGVTIHYEKELVVRTQKNSSWELNGTPMTLYPSEVKLSGDLFSVTKSKVSYGEIFDSKISGSYNYSMRHGELFLEELTVHDETMGKILIPPPLSIDVNVTEETLSLAISELSMSFSSSVLKNDWSLQLKDLGALYEYSPLLQSYLIKEGEVSATSQADSADVHFSANIPYAYPLLLKDTVPLERFQVDGVFDGHGVQATINKDIDITYDGGVSISSQDVSVNVPGIIKLLKDLPESPEDEKQEQGKLWVGLDAIRTNIVLSPKRTFFADKIVLESSGEKTSVQFKHGPGVILMSRDGDAFSVRGEDLDDTFMNGLASGVQFHEGTMSLVAKGSFDEFTTMVTIEDTIMTDFKTLNNILAMVNTIPALVTFSLPSYSTEGLPVDTIIVGGKVTKGRAAIKTLNVTSPEIKILGSGWIDFGKEKVEMDLNLITRAKENVNKIPLVGYILVGKKKKPSIAVKISGDLFDPKVEHSTFREVAITPFQMLYRTLALPAHLVTPLIEEISKGASESDGPKAYEEEMPK